MAYCQEHQPDDLKFGSNISINTFIVQVASVLGKNRCASSLHHNPLDISIWYCGRGLWDKMPTCVLLQSDKSFHSFGFDAQDKYEELTRENKQESWYFFERFTMILDENNVSITVR